MVYLCVPEHAISVASCTFEHQTPLFLTDGRFDAYVSRVAVWYSLKLFLDSGKGEIVNSFNGFLFDDTVDSTISPIRRGAL